MLVKMTGLAEGLIARPERMRDNIARGLGLHASSRVLGVLLETGLAREEAYAVVQRAALRAADERVPLRELLAVDALVAQRLSLSQLDDCFDDTRFLTHVQVVIARLDTLSEALADRQASTKAAVSGAG
jgi:adenylosuccinate lyase